MTTLYTIYGRGKIDSGLTATEAAEVLLTDDGYRYEIRRDRDGWRLYVSQHSRNSTLGDRPLVGATIWSSEAAEDAAWEDIADKVIQGGLWEKDDLQCLTDEAYAEMMRELEAAHGIEVGDIVTGVEDDSEDGKVIEIDGNQITVAWESGTRTTYSADLLQIVEG